MKANYVLLLLGVITLSCNNQTSEIKNDAKITTKSKSKKVVETADSIFINDQISNLEFQVEAFKIGSEKVQNPELKKYLIEEVELVKKLLSQYKSLAIANNYELKPMSKSNQENLYKLTIADVKGFDDVFVLYYKEFLNTNLDKLSTYTLEEVSVNELKDKYGNLIYNHKLYFDVVK